MAESTTAVLLERGSHNYTTPAELERLTWMYTSRFTSPHTQRGYGEDLSHWFRFAEAHGFDPLAGVRRPHVELYARHMEQRGLAPATRFRRIGTVRGWYEFLLDEELFDGRNPARKVHQPRVSTVRDLPYLTRAQGSLLLKAAREHSPRVSAFVHLGLVNGLRVSEIMNANVQDLGTEGYYHTLKVLRKGEQHRTVPLEPPVRAAVEAAANGRESGPLILTRDGNRMSRRPAGTLLARLCKKAGVPRMTPHALRRSAIVLLLQDGVPVREVQIFADHASSKTTERYDVRQRTMQEHLSGRVLRAVT